ncbi:hypothetical protein E4656_19815 [Natronospirillum operosum]|uniref:Uncharacterized protein n=1 Tax=Natronospirillum operosum TaxID=2759953 RepID=A0A4Z0W1B2_9GAMM|nr:DUF6404 family protein [Natronospirillum operosum]TGG89986.1 hypothetical protein E4656_19815 [Natronospirillum operosum]
MADAEFAQRRTRALQLLADKGLRRANYYPPLMRLVERLGMEMRPPHFMPFHQAVLVFGIYFGVVWGLLMWLLFWSSDGMAPSTAISTALAAGFLFGVVMAGWYQFDRRRHKLPSWEAL